MKNNKKNITLLFKVLLSFVVLLFLSMGTTYAQQYNEIDDDGDGHHIETWSDANGEHRIESWDENGHHHVIRDDGLHVETWSDTNGELNVKWTDPDGTIHQHKESDLHNPDANLTYEEYSKLWDVLMKDAEAEAEHLDEVVIKGWGDFKDAFCEANPEFCKDGEPVDPDEIDPDEIEEPEDIPDEPVDLPKENSCEEGKIKDVYDNCVECKEKTSEGDCKTCEEGSVMNTDGKCVEDCDEIKGYVHKDAFNGKAPTKTGLQHTTKTDNFRDENRALIINEDVDCSGKGKMPQGASINITSTTEVTLGGVGGYYAATFKKCEQGNLKDNLNYDSDKPCADSCSKKGNSFNFTKIQASSGSGIDGGRFGKDARKYKDGSDKAHNGTDFYCTVGTKLYATISGTVTLYTQYKKKKDGTFDLDDAGNKQIDGYGNWMQIVSDSGEKERLAHLSSYEVKSGDKINVGDYVAKSGISGNAVSQRPHLHYERYNSSGTRIDPETMIKADVDTSTGDITIDCDK